MRVLYSALHHDPRNPDLASGTDYNFYHAFLRAGLTVKLSGPTLPKPWLLERLLRRAYRRLVRRRYLKWELSTIWRSARALNQVSAQWQPDVIFSIFPAALALYRGAAPVVFRTDTTFADWQSGGAGFGSVPLSTMSWIEQRAVRNSARIVVGSEWCQTRIARSYGVGLERVIVLPAPAALPPEVLPQVLPDLGKRRLALPLRLLLVGREYHRKGVDIAIAIVAQLNAQGIPAELTVCGISGNSAPHVRYVGPYRKSEPAELQSYIRLYAEAHLLLHPARFEPSAIVPAEAAAFGVPTLTNNVGGMATSVKHGLTGLVLPGHSRPEAYASAIRGLVDHPEEYAALCQGARLRYEQEQNWDVAGKRAVSILREATALGREAV